MLKSAMPLPTVGRRRYKDVSRQIREELLNNTMYVMRTVLPRRRPTNLLTQALSSASHCRLGVTLADGLCMSFRTDCRAH